MHVQHPHTPSNLNSVGVQHRPAHSSLNTSHHSETALQRDRTIRPPAQPYVASPDPQPATHARANGHTTAGQTSNVSRRTPARAFGHQPIIETSNSPTPSDLASNRSTGTNQSNGAFFRTYEGVASSSRSNGALTPDLNFAEIGHGRGAVNNGSHTTQSHNRRGMDPIAPFSAIANSSSHGITQAMHSSGSQLDVRNGHMQVLADSSNSYRRSSDGLVTWPHVQSEAIASSPSTSPTRELHDSVQSALGVSVQESREAAEGRGRRVKRSLRNTISAAENYASSFWFRRGASSAAQDANAEWSNGMDSGPQAR